MTPVLTRRYGGCIVDVTPQPSPPDPAAAGELADVVAHGLGAIAIQAAAAEAILRKDPEKAAVPLATVRESALETLADVRRLLSLLRDEQDLCGRMPQPGLEQLGRLVSRAVDTGQPVTLTVAGTPRPVHASLQLAAFRVVQEALAAACEHAPGMPTAVELTWTPDALGIVVSDGGAGLRDSSRLQDRVRLHGGRLEAGASANGGYRVEAAFPA
jgi:signal transduction histidine kinase